MMIDLDRLRRVLEILSKREKRMNVQQIWRSDYILGYTCLKRILRDFEGVLFRVVRRNGRIYDVVLLKDGYEMLRILRRLKRHRVKQ